MTVLKCWNSGCASNPSAVRGGTSSRAPVSSIDIGPMSAMSDYPFHLASQLLVSNTASHNLFHNRTETFRVREGTEVIPETLFVQVPEQMERLDADVSPVQSALQETPEVLHRVRVNVAVHVLYGVVDDCVLVFVLQTVIRFQFVTEDSGASFDALPDGRLQFFLRAAPDVADDNLPAALDHPEHDLFICAAGTRNLLCPFSLVHIAGLPTDEGFVYFDFPAQFVEGPILHRKANPVQHKPCGLLRDSQTPVDLIAADTVFAVDDKPRGWEPLLQWQRGILKDGPGFQREAGLEVIPVALPYAGLRQPRYTLGTAMRAFHHAVRPAQLDHELAAMLEIGEVQNRVPEGCFAVHD